MRAVLASLTIVVCGVTGLQAQSYVYQSYGAKAGIAVANAIAFDWNGALVAGTNDGVVRFDGFRFDPVPLPGGAQARVVRITAGPDSSLWIQTDAGGLFRLGRDDRIARIDVPTIASAIEVAIRCARAEDSISAGLVDWTAATQ